jgi:amidophosphoribosyltransferase
MCGIVGIFENQYAARMAQEGLHALQHRGQENAGIATFDETGKIRLHTGNGYVNAVFTPEILARLEGSVAIGHTRYSTSGGTREQNAQPLKSDTVHGSIAIAHNGNIVNELELRDRLTKSGSIFATTSDTETILHLYARSRQPNPYARLKEALTQVQGAYSLVIMVNGELLAIRDPQGFRPLWIGEKDGAWIVCSETCALDLLEARHVREVDPGELVIFRQGSTESHQLFPKTIQPRQCIFEHVYFGRPDSVIFGQSVHDVRIAFGRKLASEHPADADVVVAVPDSGVCAALGFSQGSGIPYEMGLTRNHYVGRSFIQPGQEKRESNVRMKLNPVRSVIEGKRIVLVDDSIVRGTTSRKIVRLVRSAGAEEIHLRISCPPTIASCYYGIDTPRQEDLIAAHKSLEEIRQFLEVDSLQYLSLEGMLDCVKQKENFCSACFTGQYPIQPSALAIERRRTYKEEY